ncbi:hypothetical protein B0H12DRAFT_331207 [Mycena haematopus]|nr:hypothetical protein B0H12DRAFT_331207 [Mycena haematopus]
MWRRGLFEVEGGEEGVAVSVPLCPPLPCGCTHDAAGTARICSSSAQRARSSRTSARSSALSVPRCMHACPNAIPFRGVFYVLYHVHVRVPPFPPLPSLPSSLPFSPLTPYVRDETSSSSALIHYSAHTQWRCEGKGGPDQSAPRDASFKSGWRSAGGAWRVFDTGTQTERGGGEAACV